MFIFSLWQQRSQHTFFEFLFADAAGGGEAIRDARVRTVAHRTVAATAAASGAAAATTAAMAVTGGGSSGGAEEAAGAPAAAAAAAARRGGPLQAQEGAPSNPLPPRGAPAGEESLADQEKRAAASALAEAAAEAVHGHQGGGAGAAAGLSSGGGAEGLRAARSEGFTAAAAAGAAGHVDGMARPQSAGAMLGSLGGADAGGAFSPPGGQEASWEPASVRRWVLSRPGARQGSDLACFEGWLFVRGRVGSGPEVVDAPLLAGRGVGRHRQV